MSDGVPERVSWPRFEVVEYRLQSSGRARYAVMDYLNKTQTFPIDPFNKEQAGGLLLLMRQNALDKSEPVTVMRLKDAVSVPKPVRRERPKLPPQKGEPR